MARLLKKPKDSDKVNNRLNLSDFRLRLFVDTNVLIDYVEDFDEKKAATFLNLFKKSPIRKKPKIDDVELVISDYVLWEFYGRTREELYAQRLVNKYNYGYISANKECRQGNFRRASIRCMKQFGNKIKGYIRKIVEDERLIYLDRLIGKKVHGFSETVDKILQCSKFTYKDAIVLASAYFTKSNIIITCDEHFKQSRIDELEKAIKNWPINPGQIIFKKPNEFDTLAKIRLGHKNWFIERNKEKIFGNVVKYYPKRNVIEIKCRRKNLLHEGNYLYLIKFFNNKILKFHFKVPNYESGNFKSAKTKRPINKGRHITIKLPAKFPYKQKKWQGGYIFLAE